MLLGQIEGLVFSDAIEANVFLDRMPDAPDRAVAIYTQAGTEPDTRLPYEPVEFQVVTRCEADPTWALNAARAIRARLHGLRNTVLPDGVYAVFVIAQHGSPFPLGDDDNGRPRYAIDYRGERLASGTSTEERQ